MIYDVELLMDYDINEEDIKKLMEIRKDREGRDKVEVTDEIVDMYVEEYNKKAIENIKKSCINYIDVLINETIKTKMYIEKIILTDSIEEYIKKHNISNIFKSSTNILAFKYMDNYNVVIGNVVQLCYLTAKNMKELEENNEIIKLNINLINTILHENMHCKLDKEYGDIIKSFKMELTSKLGNNSRNVGQTYIGIIHEYMAVLHSELGNSETIINNIEFRRENLKNEEDYIHGLYEIAHLCANIMILKRFNDGTYEDTINNIDNYVKEFLNAFDYVDKLFINKNTKHTDIKVAIDKLETSIASYLITIFK